MTEPSRRRSTKKIGPAPRQDQDARPGQPFPPDQHASAEVADHAIEAGSIHPNVHYICRRLADHGHLALLVGGAVRDLLLGIRPKDFDLATSARPEEVERLFRNARIIGRRFRLVLVRYPDMSVEIATFRAEPGRLKNGMILRDNRYGTMEEDVRRRDFTINALTLDPLEGKLYDFVGAMDDLRAGIIRTIKPPEDSYREDPVRMLRAVRFQCRLGLKIDPECQRAIPPAAKLLGEVSRHRLADELQRLLTGGHAEAMCRELEPLGLLRPLLRREPFPWFFGPGAGKSGKAESPLKILGPLLRELDRWAREGEEPLPPTVALLALLVTLGPEELREFLAAAPEADVISRRHRQQKLDPRLADMLAAWGLLNGQVGPALAILQAANRLAGHGPEAARDAGFCAAIAGSREAWLLLGALRGVLDGRGDFLDAGLSLLPQLPDLPILDHPRPPERRRSPAKPHHIRSQRSGRSGRRRGKRKPTGERR